MKKDTPLCTNVREVPSYLALVEFIISLLGEKYKRENARLPIDQTYKVAYNRAVRTSLQATFVYAAHPKCGLCKITLSIHDYKHSVKG